MKNKENWALGLSCIAIILSVCSTLVCDKRIEADWMGILVGILAILTTVLIGWQISNYFLFERRIQKDISGLKYSVPISVCTALSQLGLALYNNRDFAGAMQSFFNSISVWDKDISNDLSAEAYQCAIIHLKKLANMDIHIIVTKEDFATHFSAAKKTGDEDIINFVRRFELKDD